MYAATIAGLSISGDGGATWTNKTTSNGLGSNFTCSVYASGSNVYVATLSGPHGNGGVSVSTNDGSSFTTYQPLNTVSSHVYRVAASGDSIYAATFSGLGISTNGGSNWITKTQLNGLGSNFISGVYATGSNVYAAANGSFGWLWFDSADKLSAQLNQATTELAGLRNRLNAASSEAELQRLQASTIPGLLPPLVPGSIAQQKAQLTEALDLSRSRLEANLSRQRTSAVANSIPGTLRVLLGAAIVAALLFTIRRHFQ